MNLLKIWGLWPLPHPRDFSSQLSCQNNVIFYHFRLAQNEFIQKLFQKWRFLRKIEISGSIVKKQAILGHFEIGRRWARSTCKNRLEDFRLAQNDSFQKLLKSGVFGPKSFKYLVASQFVNKQAILGHFEIGRRHASLPSCIRFPLTIGADHGL